MVHERKMLPACVISMLTTSNYIASVYKPSYANQLLLIIRYNH